MSTPFKIDTDVPIPGTEKKVYEKWPFRHMNVGDSVLIDAEKRKHAEQAACHYGRRSNKKFCLRKVDDDSVRVWRTA